MKKVIIFLMLLTLLSMFVVVFAQDAPKFKYTGVKKCKMCHKGDKKGKILELWQERGHSKAYATLATDHSKEIAKKAGIEGDPQQAKECLSCHTTAYNVPADQKLPTLTLEEGVSCEACHGPGSKYKSMKVMKGLFAGTMKAEDYGLIEPDKAVCEKCHNSNSPTFKELKFEEAFKKIAHPVPAKQ